MFTSRSTTPRRVRRPNPDALVASGEHRRRDFSFLVVGVIVLDVRHGFTEDEHTLDSDMMSLSQLPIRRAQQAETSLRDAYPLVPLCTIGVGTGEQHSKWDDVRQYGAGIAKGGSAL